VKKTTRLGSFEQTVLLGVLRCGNRASVAEVRQEIFDRTGVDVSTTAVHTTINRLEKKDFIKSRSTGSTQRGRPRRVFRVTGAGEAAAREEFAHVEAMADGVLT